MRFLSFFFGNQRQTSHVVNIKFVDNESTVTFTTEDGHSLNEIKNYIIDKSNVISFIQHKTISSNGDSLMYTKGIFSIDFETNKIIPRREEILIQTDIDFVLDRLN
jgi:hypothetical protein